MDRRLLIEFLPGIVFLIVHAVWGLFAATAAAIGAAIIAVVLRYRLDGQIPFLAVATVILSVVLFGVGMALVDERFIKIRPTIGGIAFAAILAVGSTFRPSLLQRSLGYKLILTPAGWRMLHLAWAGFALTLALVNELIWRNTSTDLWVAYGAISGPIAFGLYWLATWGVAWEYWDEDEDYEGADEA